MTVLCAISCSRRLILHSRLHCKQMYRWKVLQLQQKSPCKRWWKISMRCKMTVTWYAHMLIMLSCRIFVVKCVNWSKAEWLVIYKRLKQHVICIEIFNIYIQLDIYHHLSNHNPSRFIWKLTMACFILCTYWKYGHVWYKHALNIHDRVSNYYVGGSTENRCCNIYDYPSALNVPAKPYISISSRNGWCKMRYSVIDRVVCTEKKIVEILVSEIDWDRSYYPPKL